MGLGSTGVYSCLWLVLAGNQITVTVLKLVFARARSDFAVYAESSYSFPSGHSAAIAAFCIFVTYVLVRERIGRDILWLLLCISLVFLVGVSRLYLDEHFLSDVLNGYVVGVLWAITGIFAAERWRRAGRAAVGTLPKGAWPRWSSAGVVAVSAAALWLVVVDYTQTLRLVAPRAEVQLTTSVEQALKDGVLPARTESIIGTPQEPVSIILFASDDAALLDIMTAAALQVAERPTIRTLARAAVAA